MQAGWPLLVSDITGSTGHWLGAAAGADPAADPEEDGE